MSEGGGEALGPTFVAAGSFQSPQPPTPSSTVSDAGGGGDPNTKSTSSSGLPPFSTTFTTIDTPSEGLGLRLGPDVSGPDFYSSRFEYHPFGEEGLSTRLLDRGDNIHLLIPQPQYRPWESKPMDPATITTPDGYTAKMYEYPSSQIPTKLPSLGPQFSTFPVEQNGLGGDTISLTTLTPAPLSPPTNSSSLPGFPAINRSYPLVPVPTPPVQFLDDRSMQLFSSPTLSNAQYQQLASPSIIQGNFVTHSQPSHKATLVTVVNEPVTFVTQLPPQQQPQPIYHTANHAMLEHEATIKVEETSASPSPRNAHDSRKKERRKRSVATPLEAAIESDGVGSSSVESSGQVAAISSTANFNKRMQQQGMGAMGGNVSVGGGPPGSGEECENGPGEKQTKKKRKRCGECIGCRLKDNCNNCAPCRNDKSHQICKMRRCEKLTDKKVSLLIS